MLKNVSPRTDKKSVNQAASRKPETPESAKLAESLLRTMERGDATRLADELNRVEGIWRQQTYFSSKNVEQLELLSAVASDLRQSVVRLQNRRSEHLEGVHVHLYLLRHLAYDPA